MLMKSPEAELDPETETDVNICDDPYFSPDDTKRIAAIIQSYVDGVDHEGVARFRELVEFGFPYATESMGEIWIDIDGVTVEEFLADHRRVLTTCWEELVSVWHNNVTGREELCVVYDWRSDKQEYIQGMVATYVGRGFDITYVNWPDDVPRPAPGMTMSERQDHNGRILSRNAAPAAAPKTTPAIPPGTTVKAADRGNFGKVVSDNGDTVTVHFVSKDGQHANKDLPRGELRNQDGSPLDGTTVPLPRIKTMRQLLAEYPELRPPVVDGLLRSGETGNIVANTKFGKSWLGLGLAFAVATGGDWLGTFRCTQGRVLLLDNELHPETIAHRLGLVASALGVEWDDDVADLIDAAELRGVGADLHGLAPLVDSIEAGYYQLVIADAWYRFLPPGVSENDNAQIMALYNRLDAYTGRMQSAWINIHHASKGPQDGKTVTDVGAGAGAQSRAADTHIILRPHEDEDTAVMEAAVRSWRRVEPLSIKWDFPLWRLADGADPRQLRRQLTPKQRQQQAEDEATAGKIIAAFLGGKVHTARSLGGAVGIGKPRLERLLNQLQAAGRIVSEETVKRGNTCYEYRLSPAAERDEHDDEPQCGEEPQGELFDDVF